MILSWQMATILSGSKLNSAMRKMNNTGMQTLIVCDEELKLVGTISDGDIRKALVRGHTINDAVDEIMNNNPVTISLSTSQSEILNIFMQNQFKIVPILENNVVIGCEFIDDYIGLQNFDVPLLIIAGGFGKRLGSLTKKTPKPLLEIKGKPIIHHIVDKAQKNGIKKVLISIHYLGEKIKSYFGDGANFGLQIDYIEEIKPLGTAGCFNKIPENLTGPILISNADIISEIDYKKLIQHHNSNDADITVVVYEYKIQHQFGVVQNKGIEVTNFEEKPTWRSWINTGMYVFDASIKNLISPEENIDMPELIMRAKKNGKKAIIYQISNEWFDIGNPSDYENLK